MKKPLLDVLFMSEKRKQVLLLLQEGPNEMEVLLKSLGTSRQALLPQVRILEEHHLVGHYRDTYELTVIGKLIVNEMKPFLDTLETIDNHISYLGTHDIDFIPSHILKRIKDIKGCEVIEPSLVNIYEINMDFVEMSKESSSLFFIFTFMHPTFPTIMEQFIRNKINVSIVVSKEMLKKITEEWQDEFYRFVSSGKVKFYLCQKELRLLSLSLNDDCFVLRLFSKNNEFSNRQLFCCNPEAHQWSKDLFEYYLRDSILVTAL
jgi:predicted transcriptional regulator